MRGTKFRIVCASLLATFCAALSYLGAALAQPQPPGIAVKSADKTKDGKDKKDERPAGDESLPIGLPYDRDSRNQLKAAREYLYDTSREYLMKELAAKVVGPLLADGKVEKAEHDALADKFRNLISTRDDLRTEIERGLEKRLGPDGLKAVRDDLRAMLDMLPDLTSLDPEKRGAAEKEFDKRADQKIRVEVERRLRDRPWNTICPLLQNILNANSDSFFTLEEKVGDRTEYHRISVKTEANRIIAAFPREGLQFYQQAHGQDAADILAAAARNNYDLPTLSDLSQRYFHTKAGAEGTAALASIYLERGNYLEAAYAFERLMNRPDTDELLTPRTLFKAALALKRSGDPRHVAVGKAVWEKIERATRGNGLTIGRKTFTSDQLRAELDRPVGIVRTDATVGEWAMRYGNAQRNGTVTGGPPFLEPAFRPISMFYTGDNEGNTWIKGELDRLYGRDGKPVKGGPPMPAFFPLTTPDLIVFRSYDAVYAYSTRDHTATVRGEPRLYRAGSIRWHSTTEAGMYQLMTSGGMANDPDAKSHAGTWWNQFNQMDGSSILYENPLLGSLAHDGSHVYFIDDVALPPPPIPQANEFGFRGPITTGPQSGLLADSIRAGRLTALNIHTGKEVWSLGRPNPTRYVEKADGSPPPAPLPRLTEEEADKTTNAHQLCLDAIFLGPPLPLNGRLYVLVEQSGAIRLLCLDPRALVGMPGRIEKVPSLVWSQKLGKPNNPLPADSVRRYQGAFLAASEGVIVCPTNSGAVVGVDIMSRSLLWARAYAKVPPTPARLQYDPNTGMPLPPKMSNERWRAAAPIISGGRVVVAAFDSPSLECIDLRTGRVLWETRRQADDLYVGGVVNDRVIVVGKNSVRAYHLAGEDATDRQPKLAWGPVQIPTPTGHGAAGRFAYFVPVRQDNAGKDGVPAAEIWAIGVESGAVTSKTASRKRADPSELAKYGLGNLVFQDGIVFAQSPWEVSAFPQLEQKRAEMDRRLKDNPNDPQGLTDRGELLLDDGKLKAAIDDFKAAQKHLTPKDVGLDRRLRDKLHDAIRELLRADFAAGEPFLKEYEALCEMPLDTDDPHEKQFRIDETLRRKRTYLYLLARGREGQGRLPEAFDNYMTLANLGEGKQLIEMPDEANVRMRPDVWARGRIEAMIRGARTPEARKALEDRVGVEWEKVKTATDLARLKEFVAVFGPYFATGAEAQFKLADVLLGTNNETDAREAQGYLSQLRVDADDPAVRARATERLARMMVKNGMVEDAVGLYLQLGKDYPAVVVRDGKTGADYVTDLLTDKRLLPYIEPSRYPLPARVKAEARQGNFPSGISFEVEPEGELLPMFRRLRFVLDTQISGNQQSWTLIAYDRSTGAARCKFQDIVSVQNNDPTGRGLGNGLGNVPFSKHVQASGHLLLVHVGTWVYCFDLAEKTQRWRKNLLGDSVQPQTNMNLTTEPDGEFSIKGDESAVFTLGKSAILQPGYVCLRTSEGLEVIEPVTRRVLWKRTGLANRTHIYGDARHVLIVEIGEDRKPTATKLVRAVDGVVVAEARDAGKTMAAAKSYKAFGRTVLLSEGGDDKPRSLRLLDLATNADVWKKEFDPKAVPVKAMNPEWCGFVQPNGEAEVIESRTGKTVSKVQLDADANAHVKACVEAQVFADAERLYVVLDKEAAAAGVGVRVRYPAYSLRTQKVNGPIYCFDRATAKRQWFYEDVLDNQTLILDRFADFPVVIAANQIPDPVTKNYVYRVVVIEKSRGLLVYNASSGNNAPLQHIDVDVTNGRIDLQRYDMQIRITPETDGKLGLP